MKRRAESTDSCVEEGSEDAKRKVVKTLERMLNGLIRNTMFHGIVRINVSVDTQIDDWQFQDKNATLMLSSKYAAKIVRDNQDVITRQEVFNISYYTVKEVVSMTDEQKKTKC